MKQSIQSFLDDLQIMPVCNSKCLADVLALYLYYDVSIRDINAMLGGKYTTTYANIRRLCRELETLCSAQEVTGHEE